MPWGRRAPRARGRDRARGGPGLSHALGAGRRGRGGGAAPRAGARTGRARRVRAAARARRRRRSRGRGSGAPRERKGDEPEPAPAGPRRTSDEDRHYATLLRLLVDHGAALVQGGRRSSSPSRPTPSGARSPRRSSRRRPTRPRSWTCSRASRSGASLRSRTSPAPTSICRPALRASSRDELRWLGKRREEHERTAVKARIASGDAGALEELQPQLARRGAARSLPPN